MSIMNNLKTNNLPPSKRILIMAGGTGGHVFPALAVARALQKQGFSVEWLGTRQGMEAKIVKEALFPLHFISVTGIRRSGFIKALLAPFRLLLALFQAIRIIKRVKPDVVLGMGGFAAGPGGVAAWLLGIPLVIHEQNAIAGTTNRYLSFLACHILEAFPGSFKSKSKSKNKKERESESKSEREIKSAQQRLKRKSAICTGNPVRNELLQLPSPNARFEQRKGNPLNILVLGGSQGAMALNTLCPESFIKIPDVYRPVIKHQTGQHSYEETLHRYEKANLSAMVSPFIENMAEAYAWADLVICRAGALTVSELIEVGVGSILVPFPYAVDDHQTYNGQFLEKGGGALMIAQPLLNPSMLADIIVELSQDRQKILEMALAAKKLSKPDAVEKVTGYCIEASRSNK